MANRANFKTFRQLQDICLGEKTGFLTFRPGCRGEGKKRGFRTFRPGSVLFSEKFPGFLKIGNFFYIYYNLFLNSSLVKKTPEFLKKFQLFHDS